MRSVDVQGNPFAPKTLGSRYRVAALRAYLHRYHIRYTIARRSKDHRRDSFNKQRYRNRNIVERLINRIKQFRRIATRYEK